MTSYKVAAARALQGGYRILPKDGRGYPIYRVDEYTGLAYVGTGFTLDNCFSRIRQDKKRFDLALDDVQAQQVRIVGQRYLGGRHTVKVLHPHAAVEVTIECDGQASFSRLLNRWLGCIHHQALATGRFTFEVIS